ncbi:MAG: hypothetical protein HY660_15460 [Armatimonadetes bacterium]|nr:hypothetical protein [Armatimonadota bacterium]
MRCAGAAAAVIALALLVAAGGIGAEARQGPEKVAIAEFVGEAPTFGEVADLVPRILAEAIREASRGRLRIVEARIVRGEMVRRRWTSSDLVSLTNAAELGRAVNADVMVTWQVSYFDSNGGNDGANSRGFNETMAAVRIRAMEVATRRRLVDAEFSGSSFRAMRYEATREALANLARKAARAIVTPGSVPAE